MHAEQLRLFAQIEDRHWWFAARRRILRSLVERLLPSRGARILDIGCGTGGNLGALAPDYVCTGVDASSTAVALARERFPKIEFICDVGPEQLQSLAARADLVLMMDVLEHMADDFRFLSRLLAATRPGTTLFITVPADMSLWSLHDETVLHYRRYDLARLAAVWEGLPVKLRLCSHFNSRLYPLIQILRWWNQRRRHTSGPAGTDFDMRSAWTNAMLERFFAGEASRLLQALDRPAVLPYQRGVSLLALLERLPGNVPVRSKPVSLAPDPFTPPIPNPVAA